MNIGLIGAGHLGKAFLSGLSRNGVRANTITVNARTEDTMNSIKAQYPDINVTSDKKELIAESDMVVIAVKPQNAREVITGINAYDWSDKIIVSFMAGITLADLRELFNDKDNSLNIIRVMPSIGIATCKGVMGFCYEGNVPRVDEVKAIFEKLGYVITLSEDRFDNVMVSAASGLAFVTYLMKEYRDACDLLLNDTEASETITRMIFENALEIVESGAESMESLIDKICTKGGVTEAGIEALEKGDIKDKVSACFDAALKRTNELLNN
jgi:pyrroline-5-carboxylate reductase